MKNIAQLAQLSSSWQTPVIAVKQASEITSAALRVNN